jgi:hypothetical protein
MPIAVRSGDERWNRWDGRAGATARCEPNGTPGLPVAARQVRSQKEFALTHTPAGAELFTTVDLTAQCNSSARAIGFVCDAGRHRLRGIPFAFAGTSKFGAEVIALAPGDAADIPIHASAGQVVVAHRLVDSEILDGAPHGKHCGRYVVTYEDGEQREWSLRERFEISAVPPPSNLVPFCAWADAEIALFPREHGRFADVGARLAEVDLPPPAAFYLTPLANPRPEVPIAGLRLIADDARICVGAVTLASTTEPLFPRTARRLVTFTFRNGLSNDDVAKLELRVRRGVASYLQPLEPETPEAFLRGALPGWGSPRSELAHGTYCYVTASPTAEMELVLGSTSLGMLRWVDLLAGEDLEVADDVSARLHRTPMTWVHTTVVDRDSRVPLPCRVHFRSLFGLPLQPDTHANHVGVGEDQRDGMLGFGLPSQADVAIGGTVYAYVPGRCEGWLPEGEVLVDVAAGFDYEPLRARVPVAPGQRELTLELSRRRNLRARGFFGGDTHVHQLPTRLAHLHAAAEGLDVVNLLAVQIGHSYDGFGELTGLPDHARRLATTVYVGQENMAQALGHLVLLNAREPILPVTAGGPYEGELGNAVQTTLSRWADECHALGGTVIGAHHPSPNAELAVLAATGRVDALEWMAFQRYNHLDYYRYLDAGYQIPLVMGTDRMAPDKPIGVNRTYVRIPDGVPFTYANWCRYLTEGRTFVSNGPAVDLVVDGAAPGDTIDLDHPGETVVISATAEGPMPVERLEIVINGIVPAVATRADADGVIRIRHLAAIREDSWIVARCGGDPYLSGSAHLFRRGHVLGAHTSPVYVAVGGPWARAERTALHHHLALVEGGLAYLRSVAAHWPKEYVRHHHAHGDHQAYLEEPFHVALARLRRKLGSDA